MYYLLQLWLVAVSLMLSIVIIVIIVIIVFIISGARTGSTRLHEVMAHAAGNKFVSFTLQQFFNPYLTYVSSYYLIVHIHTMSYANGLVSCRQPNSGQWLLTLVSRADQYWFCGFGARLFRLAESRAIPRDMQCNISI
jgi:hypothetical protein